MDPNAALAEIVRAIAAGDFEDAEAYLTDLRRFHERGGFLPTLASLRDNL